MEAELGLPTFYRSKPIVERMAALGYDQAAIDHVKTWLDVLTKIVSGCQDELPDQVKNELAADATRNYLAPSCQLTSFRTTGRPDHKKTLP